MIAYNSKGNANGKRQEGGGHVKKAVREMLPIIEVPIAGTGQRMEIIVKESAIYVKSLNERKLAPLYAKMSPLLDEIRLELAFAAEGQGSPGRAALLEGKFAEQCKSIREIVEYERKRLNGSRLDTVLATLVQVEQSLVSIPAAIGTYLAAFRKRAAHGGVALDFRKKVEASLNLVDGLFSFYGKFSPERCELVEPLFLNPQMGELVRQWKEIEQGG